MNLQYFCFTWLVAASTNNRRPLRETRKGVLGFFDVLIQVPKIIEPKRRPKPMSVRATRLRGR